ncbi:MAG: alpha/beta fold hydrolase [Candidatus Thorarchaeota archaeon]|nr:alpha/beta fold hydrolase [Candidatus Thorarchaeota archaeon]
MQAIKPRLSYIILIFTLILMLSGIALAASVQSNMGSVIVTEVDFQADDGSNIHATLQQPIYATSTNPLPGVIVFHGSLQNKEWLMAFGIELARRGFVVLTPDANGHGNSDYGSGSGPAALEYFVDLDYVDSSSIGLIGHSMGGGSVWQAINESTVTVGAAVLVGSGSSSDWNATYPNNVLITVGSFDSLSSYPRNTTRLEPLFGVTGIEEYVTYGDFADGSARRFAVASTNHLFETINPEIVTESVEWMKNSLKGGVEDSNWIASSSLTYGWWLAGGFFATLGAVLTIFPLIAILLDISVFESLKKEPSLEYNADKRSYLTWGILYGAVPAATFFPLLLIGQFVPFPQSYGAAISIWFVGTALVLLLILKIAMRGKSEEGLDLKKFLKIGSDQQSPMSSLVKTFLLASITVLWLYMWTLLVDLGLALDFRSFLPGMNDLTISRALFVPIYAIVFFIYFLIDGMWLMGPLKPENSEPWYKGMTNWTLKGMLIKCYPFVILIGIEFGLGMLLGYPVIPGIIGYSFLFFYAFAPWFAVSAVITIWSYRSTDRYYLGALINALFFAWMLATTLSFRL